MSVVGPRPALPNEVEKYTPRQMQRLLVKPGMTCYWQTRRNRDAITFAEWVELDLWKTVISPDQPRVYCLNYPDLLSGDLESMARMLKYDSLQMDAEPFCASCF